MIHKMPDNFSSIPILSFPHPHLFMKKIWSVEYQKTLIQISLNFTSEDYIKTYQFPKPILTL